MDVNIYNLNLTKSITEQVLILAGWYAGRQVDISDLLFTLSNNNIMTNSFSERFWSEYYGIKDTWYFKWEDKNGTVHLGGWEFSFDTNIPRIYPIHFETPEEFQEEINQIPKKERQCVVPICEVGFHDPGILWINDAGRVFWTLYFDEEEALVFDSPFMYLQSELESFTKEESKVLLSFSHEIYMSWVRDKNRK